jgi:DNA-binding SARP family transcriptional activator
MGQRTSLAKISRPRLFGAVPRQRLFSLLDANFGRPLIWVSGPPGAGKTTLIASFLEERNCPTLWLQIDAGDADPASFFHYVTLGAMSFSCEDAVPVPRFSAEHVADIPAFTRLFFRAVFARVPERCMLVLDNYQELAVDASLHEVVRQAIAEVPPGSSVIGISRVEAPARFSQLVASGAMANLGWEALQLTVEEVRTIAAQRQVTDDWLIKSLHQQSQGWAAGVTLMLERLGHFSGKADELPTETREAVFNYFASLIFDQASDATRHILLSIAFLPRVTPALACELSSDPDAQHVLDDLFYRRMFIDRRGGAEPVYQFHALFLDFLRTRAREVLEKEEVETLMLRSALALESGQDVDTAMELWLAARDWDHATALILKAANHLLRAGRRQTLVQWIHALPDECRSKRPWLVYWLGCAQLQSGPEEGVKTLEYALALFRESEDRKGKIECLAALLGGTFLGFHGLLAMDHWIDPLLTEIEYSEHLMIGDRGLKIKGVVCMALFHVRPWHPWTLSAYNEVEDLLPMCVDPTVGLAAAMHALVVSGLSGDFERGDRIVKMGEGFASRDSASPSESAWWYAQVGWLRFMEGRYEAALASLARGQSIGESNGLSVVLRQINLWRFTVQWRLLDWNEANITLVQVEAMQAPRSPMTQAQIYLFGARRARYRGHKDMAANLAILCDQVVASIGSRLQEVIIGLSNVDILLDAGRIEGVPAILAHVRQTIERAPAYRCWFAALVFLEAQYALHSANRSTALRQLRESLILAQEGNSRHYLRFCDWSMPPMFCLALEEGIAVDLVTELIRMFRLRPPQEATDTWPWPVRISTFGRFAVQVSGEKLEFSRKLPRKTLLLLRAIVSLGGQDIPEQMLCDALWGDEEGDAARNALSVSISRLRKLLGTNDAVQQQGGKVSLDREVCWVDAWCFENRLLAEPSKLTQALGLYGGTFLPEDQGEAWSVATRERLRGKFIHALSSYGQELEKEASPHAAIQCYQRGIDADPIVEEFHVGLMRCYERMARRTEALSVYRRMKHTLSVVLGVPPSEASQMYFQDLLNKQVEDGSGTEITTQDGSAATITTIPVRRSGGRRK